MSATNDRVVRLSRVEGNPGSFNDVLVLANRDPATKARFNLIYFGGDVQDYEEEMTKSLTSRNFTAWNLSRTAELLFEKFASRAATRSNVLVFRADFFHLRTFANYSNFVLSTDFGVPIDPSTPNEFEHKLDDDDDESSNSSISTKPTTTTATSSFNKLRCLTHTQRLFQTAINEYNRQTDQIAIDETLPIVICSFSKGCVVLNQICRDLVDCEDDEFRSRLRHFVWLDGGHSGNSNSWIVDEAVVGTMKSLGIACYVYVTPYQMKSLKTWAIQEHEKFIELLEQLKVTYRRVYYFEDEDDVDAEMHFQVIQKFDSDLIIA